MGGQLGILGWGHAGGKQKLERFLQTKQENHEFDKMGCFRWSNEHWGEHFVIWVIICSHFTNITEFEGKNLLNCDLFFTAKNQWITISNKFTTQYSQFPPPPESD